MALKRAFLLLALVAACSSASTRKTAAPPPPLYPLGEATADQLRRAFDEADGVTRYIFAFSPT